MEILHLTKWEKSLYKHNVQIYSIDTPFFMFDEPTY